MRDNKELIAHYNKFSEEKRLTRRHGQVEYITSMKYIHKYLEQIRDKNKTDHGNAKEKSDIKILDIGAGTGRYSVALAKEGYDVSAVELVKYNVGILKSKDSSVKAYQGSALKLKRFQDETFDLTLLFGPMYHLFSEEDKVQALKEAKRVTKKEGVILVAYIMNEYSILVHGFRDNHILECMKEGKITADFHVKNQEEDLYDYVRLDDIDRFNEKVGAKRIQIIAATGPANYIRKSLHEMNEETFALFMEYHLSTCEREDLLGWSSHLVDIIQPQ